MFNEVYIFSDPFIKNPSYQTCLGGSMIGITSLSLSLIFLGMFSSELMRTYSLNNSYDEISAEESNEEMLTKSKNKS